MRSKRKPTCKRPWQEVWHASIAPRIGLEGLKVLKAALEADDATLVQGSTVLPDVTLAWRTASCRAACALAYPFWRTLSLETIADVEVAFNRLCGEVDQEQGEGGARRFVEWFDGVPRDTMRRELLVRVERAIEHETLGPLLRGCHEEGGQS